MKGLIKLLTEQTNSLRIQYLEFTKEWAKNNHIYLQTITEQSVINEYGYTSHFSKTKGEKYHTHASLSRWNKIYKEKTLPLEIYVDVQLKNAQSHYEVSIEKLADKIIVKSLNINDMKIEYSHIGRNVDILFVDGNKQVKAQTILAQGEINRPHYRYLVK